MKKSIVPFIVLFAATTAADANEDAANNQEAPVKLSKAPEKMTQLELREFIEKRSPETAAADLKAIDDQKLSSAKTKQALINLIATFTTDEEIAEAKTPEAKTSAKETANVAALTAAGFVLADGRWTKADSEIVVTEEEGKTLAASKLTAKLNPKPAVVPFAGYTDEDKAKFEAMKHHHVTFRPSGRYGDAVKTNNDGTVDGIVKNWKIETRSERVYIEIHVEGLPKSAWTRDTSAGFKLGAKATDAELIAAKLMKAPKADPAPTATETAAAAPTTENAAPEAK